MSDLYVGAAGVSHITGLNDLSKSHWLWVESMGWHNKTSLESIMLIVSECGEAANEVRGQEPTDEFGTELADIILRTMDLAYENGIDLEKAIADKMAKNMSLNPCGKGRIK